MRRTISLVARMVSGAWVAIWAASACARLIRASGVSNSSLTSPTASASSAPIRRVVMTMSTARPTPVSAATLAMLVAESMLASVRAMGKPNLRLRVAMRRSQAAAITAAPPVQMPGMAAMVGTGQRSSLLNTFSMRSS